MNERMSASSELVAIAASGTMRRRSRRRLLNELEPPTSDARKEVGEILAMHDAAIGIKKSGWPRTSSKRNDVRPQGRGDGEHAHIADAVADERHGVVVEHGDDGFTGRPEAGSGVISRWSDDMAGRGDMQAGVLAALGGHGGDPRLP
jgi:hypothetical protein